MSGHIWLFLVSVWRRDPIHDSIQIFAQLNLNSSGSLTDSLLGRGNNHVNLSLGPGINPSNYEDTLHYSLGGWRSWLQLTSA